MSSELPHQRPPLAQILLAFAGIYIIWGTTFLAIAFVIRTIPPFFSGGVRFLIASALLYAWLRLHEPRPFSRLHIGGSILIGVLMSGMGNGFVVWSQQGLPSGIAALFVGMLPVSTLLLDWIFFSRRRPKKSVVVSDTSRSMRSWRLNGPEYGEGNVPWYCPMDVAW